MQIRDSDFFSQLACCAGAGSATPALEALGDEHGLQRRLCLQRSHQPGGHEDGTDHA